MIPNVMVVNCRVLFLVLSKEVLRNVHPAYGSSGDNSRAPLFRNIQLTPRLPWSPEETARRFHDAYEELAPTFGYSTRPESRMSWDRLSEPMRSLMIATVRAVFIERAADALDGGVR